MRVNCYHQFVEKRKSYQNLQFTKVFTSHSIPNDSCKTLLSVIQTDVKIYVADQLYGKFGVISLNAMKILSYLVFFAETEDYSNNLRLCSFLPHCQSILSNLLQFIENIFMAFKSNYQLGFVKLLKICLIDELRWDLRRVQQLYLIALLKRKY